MSDSKPQLFKARAFDSDAAIQGRIDEAPIGNINEFVAAHMTGEPWEPDDGLATRVEVTRDE